MMSFDSFIRPDEHDALFSHFGPDAVVAYRDVCNTQLSILRHWRGGTVNGHAYIYVPLTDELIRRDVYTWLQKRRALAAREQRIAEREHAAVSQATLGF